MADSKAEASSGMERVFGPAAFVLERLRYAPKFALMGVIFFLPVAVLGMLQYRSESAQYRFNMKETLGVSYIKAAHDVLGALQRHRLDLQAGDTESASAAADSPGLRAVDEAVAVLDALDARLGGDDEDEGLKTTPRWTRIRADWQAVRAQAGSAVVDAELDRLCGEMSRLILDDACNSSNLMLDPALDSFYLMDAFCAKIPVLTELATDQAVLALRMRQAGALDDDKRIELAGMYRMMSATVGDLVALNAETAYRETADTQLKSVLTPHFTRAKTAVDDFGAALRKDFLGATVTGTRESAIAPARAALAALVALHDAVAPQLDALIVTRATEKYLRPRNTGLVAVGVALLALGYLLMALYISVTRSIARVRAAAEGMLQGTVRSVSLGTADEIGDIATSFNQIAGALQEAERAAERAELAAEAAEHARSEADGEKARAVVALEQARVAELEASHEKARVEHALRAADEHRRSSQEAQSALAVENERKLELMRSQADAATTLRDKIDRILRVVQSASAGNFKDRVAVGGSDPIDTLAVQLNGLFERVDGTLSHVEQASDNLSRTADQFVSLNRSLTNSAKETETVADRALSLATEAKDESNRLTTQANDIRSSSTDIHNRAQANARTSTDVAERATATEAVARELAQASRDIAGFTRVITTISAQTRLLALNATIEASRAGEAGRGFAVVASEVKDLAQQTEAAADQVQTQTTRIQQVVEQVEQAIAQIIDRSAQIREQSHSVLSSVEAQGTATSQMFELIAQSIEKLDEINSNLITVKQVARNGTASAESIHAESEQMSLLGSRLRDVVAQFKSSERAGTVGRSSTSTRPSFV